MRAQTAIEPGHRHEDTARILIHEVGRPVESHLSRTGHRGRQATLQAREIVARVGSENGTGTSAQCRRARGAGLTGRFIVTAHGVKLAAHDDILIRLGRDGSDEAGLRAHPPDRMGRGIRIALVEKLHRHCATHGGARCERNLETVCVHKDNIINSATEQTTGQTLPAWCGVGLKENGGIGSQPMSNAGDGAGIGNGDRSRTEGEGSCLQRPEASSLVVSTIQPRSIQRTIGRAIRIQARDVPAVRGVEPGKHAADQDGPRCPHRHVLNGIHGVIRADAGIERGVLRSRRGQPGHAAPGDALRLGERAAHENALAGVHRDGEDRVVEACTGIEREIQRAVRV